MKDPARKVHYPSIQLRPDKEEQMREGHVRASRRPRCERHRRSADESTPRPRWDGASASAKSMPAKGLARDHTHLQVSHAAKSDGATMQNAGLAKRRSGMQSIRTANRRADPPTAPANEIRSSRRTGTGQPPIVKVGGGSHRFSRKRERERARCRAAVERALKRTRAAPPL